MPNPNFAVNLPAPAGTGQGGAIGLSLGSLGGNFNLARAPLGGRGDRRRAHHQLAAHPDARQPRGAISQGTSIPFSQVSAQGVQTTFQEAQLPLHVKPHVTSDGTVAMHVKINRDEPDFNQTSARGDPTILKREAETSLLVKDGHTAVIGGIYTRNTGYSLDQVPFFGDIPILGLLFQRTQHARRPQRAADLPHAAHREPQRSAQSVGPELPKPPQAPGRDAGDSGSCRIALWRFSGVFWRLAVPALVLRVCAASSRR